MNTADLHDKLINSNLGNWFILPINDSAISWIRDRYSSDIEHALVNSSMQVIPMNLINLLTGIIDYANHFIKNLTNLGKKNIYIGLN